MQRALRSVLGILPNIRTEERMKKCGLNPNDFTSYLEAFKYGMPPHGGFGFGIERFLMELLDINNIRECILYPRDRTRLTP